MVDVDVCVIDNEEYYVMAEENIKDTVYLFLSKVNDDNFTMIRKRDKDNANLLVTLDNEAEVKMVALVLTEKIFKNKNRT